MSIAELIAEKMKTLPSDKQKEVLDFATFLEQKTTTRTSRRGCKGLWEDIGIDVSPDDITQARREMWGNFPRGNAV